MKAKDAIAHILRAEGVTCFTCYPDNAIIDAVAALDVRPVLARTERVAVNIADGFTRINNGRQIGVSALQYAGGIENAYAGVAQAYGDSTPILLLPSGYERSEQGVPPNFSAVRAYSPVTKWAETVNHASRVPQMMQRAFTQLRNGKPGPVLLEVPTDVMDEEVGAFTYLPTKASRPHGDPADVREAVRVLLHAKSPVIVAGQGIFFAEAWDELKAFAELVEAPVMTTLNGKSCFPEDHPLALGAGGHSRPRTVDHFLAKADVVFGIGTSFTRSVYTANIPRGKTLVQITNSEADINKDHPVAHAVIGDAKAVLAQMIDEARVQLRSNGHREGDAVVREIAAVKAAFLKDWWPRLTANDAPVSPYRVIWELAQTLDRSRTIMTHDAGNPRDQMTPFYEAIAPHGYIGWGKTTQLGTGLGLAMGAKLAARDKLVVNFMGDAAFGMVGMDFETAVRMRIPILTVVINNGMMGGYDKFLPLSTERFGTRYLSGDFSRVADALGGYTERVEKTDGVAPAIRRCVTEVDAGRPALLEIITHEDPVLALAPDSKYRREM
jgi:acetolactate synthase-1/2/3 large subunit